MRIQCAVLLLSASIATLAMPSQAVGQDPEATALLQYNIQKKSEWGAVALEWVAPVVGHAYAGDAKRGIVPAVVTVGGLAGFVAGIRCDSMCAVSGDSANNETMAWVGLAVLVAGRTWGYLSAYQTAADHNAGLRERLGISLGGTPDRVEVGLALRF